MAASRSPGCTVTYTVDAQTWHQRHHPGKTPGITRPNAETAHSADFVNYTLNVECPIKLWVADIIYVKTHTRCAYAAFVVVVLSPGWWCHPLLHRPDVGRAEYSSKFHRAFAGKDTTGSFTIRIGVISTVYISASRRVCCCHIAGGCVDISSTTPLTCCPKQS